MHFYYKEVHFFYKMEANKLIKYLEGWAPPGSAWKDDNVGLQIGSRWTTIKAIFLCLELNEKTLNEAISKKCNFIFTHHPLIFKPIYKLTPCSDEKSKIIEKIIKNDIVVYCAHTNLDFTKDGVNYELAKTLGLRNIKFLETEKGNQVKLTVFVPHKNVDEVSEAIFNSGGGIIGEYSKCSYRSEGTGTFEGSSETNPHLGQKQNFEKVDEVKLEVLVNQWQLSQVVNAMIKAHPYEEPAYDIYPLKNNNVNFGSGAIGQLDKALSVNEFLTLVEKNLKTKQLRYCKGRNSKIKTVAVHGGSISGSLNAAIADSADALVTSDVKYHTFQDAEDKILLIDAGHYETEIHVLKAVKRKLTEFLKRENMKVEIVTAAVSTNPIRIINNKE